MALRLPGREREDKLEQPAKALSSIFSTSSGTTMSAKLIHPLNVEDSTASREEGSLMDVRLLQLKKAPEEIVSTVSGMFMDFKSLSNARNIKFNNDKIYGVILR